jgi:hypothetical protein
LALRGLHGCGQICAVCGDDGWVSLGVSATLGDWLINRPTVEGQFTKRLSLESKVT